MAYEKIPQTWTRLNVKRGMVHVYYAFDTGQRIRMEDADQRITALKERTTRIKSKKRVSQFFEFTPAPIRVTQSCPELEVGPGFRTRNTVDALLFDFGAISIRFQIPFSGSMVDAIHLSDALYANTYLRDQARFQVELLLKEIAPAVTSLNILGRVEDYSVFQVEEFDREVSIEDLITKYADAVAAVLSSEVIRLAQEDVQERVHNRISYSQEDVSFIDWNNAFVFDDDAEEICSVLEFTNIALLEFSLLDDQLDRALDEFYNFFQKGHHRLRFGSASLRKEQRKIARLQIDSAILFEGVSNALKLLGDEYLARLYRLASKRLGLANWDESISRKLRTIESIYTKVSNEENAKRMENIEWVIVLLIAVSIVIPFIPGLALK